VGKKPLIGFSICAVVLLVLGSLSNVVGYQQLQSSNQQIINEEIHQKELLFQTIVDFANNREIQRIILKHQISRGDFPVLNIPVTTKNQLKQMYLLGLILSKYITKTRMLSIIGKYQFDNQEMQKEISAVIEKNPTLKAEITQLQNSECDCGNKSTTRWPYPVMCSILGLMFFGLSFTFVFFDKVISDGLLRDNPILVLMVVLIWLEVGALLTTVDCLFNIYCKTEVLVV